MFYFYSYIRREFLIFPIHYNFSCFSKRSRMQAKHFNESYWLFIVNADFNDAVKFSGFNLIPGFDEN